MRKNKFLLKLSILILVITAVAVVKFQTSNEVLAQSNLTDNSANNIGSNLLKKFRYLSLSTNQHKHERK